MNRLSLLAFAMTVLMTASGCCCGLCGHGCNTCGYGGCGYQPAYPAYAAPPCGGCSTCPTCPSGGCGVQGPVFQQGAFFDGNSVPVVSSTPAGIPTVASAEPLRTF